MRIVISHLTRMHPGFVCAAGIDLETCKGVRPVLARPKSIPLEHCRGGTAEFGLYSIIDLAHARPCGQQPEVEDHEVTLESLRACGQMAHSEFWRLLSRLAKPHVWAIFGPELQGKFSTYATDANTGSASLGYLRKDRVDTPRLVVRTSEDGRQLRLQYRYKGYTKSLRVTDLRFYDNKYEIRQAVVDKVNDRLAGGENVIFGMGLSRPWPDHAPKHWLQVNGIHFEEGNG